MTNQYANSPGGVMASSQTAENPFASACVLPAPPFRIQKILVPVDFSDCAMKAVHYAVAFAHQFNAELHLLHVAEPLAAVPELGPVSIMPLRESAEALEVLRANVSDTTECHALLRSGSPCTEIVKAAAELEVDLILISTRGHRGVAHMLLGSTAEKVVRYAGCPVLIVRECERDFVPALSVASGK